MQKLTYIRCGDYYIPDIRLPEENRPIGRWGRMHRDYIKENNLIRFNDLCLSGDLWTYLADLNEQAQSRLELIIEQMKAAEGVTENMKATIRFNDLCLSGDLWTYLADLNEQAQSRLELIIEQMKAAEGVTENMKATDQMAWGGAMNSIRNRAEEIVTNELIYN